MKILTGIEIGNVIAKELNTDSNPRWFLANHFYLEIAVKAQADLTLKEIIEWGESGCPHNPTTKMEIEIDDEHFTERLFQKSDCPKCWVELKKGEIK
jgi:hypothetical protein